MDRWLAFAFGIIFISALLYLATVEKNPTPLAIRVYVTVLSLAAAGVGAILPGFFELRYKSFVRAGGAIGLGVLVYLNEPAIGKYVPNFIEPPAPAEPLVGAFLSAIDTGDPSRSWALLSESGRQQVSGGERTWAELYNNTLAPLGKNLSRALVHQSKVQSPMGAPPGLYRSFTYQSRYTNDNHNRAEAVVVRAISDRAWGIYSYQIGP